MITILGSSPVLFLVLIVLLLEILLLLTSRKKEFSNKKTSTVLFIPFFIFIILPLMWLFIIQLKWKNNIMYKIEEANYCEVDDDCVLVLDFNCGGYINKDKTKEIQKDLDFYDLMSIEPICSSWGKSGKILETKPKCENNKCIIKSTDEYR